MRLLRRVHQARAVLLGRLGEPRNAGLGDEAPEVGAAFAQMVGTLAAKASRRPSSAG